MFFKSSVNKHCDYANVYLSGDHIDFVQDVKYLGVSPDTEILCTSQYATAQLSLLW